MGILMVIVLMMATLFHSSTMAWTNGLRQAEMSLQARSVISLIQRDVSQAVVDGSIPLLDCAFSANSIEVCTPVGGGSTNRAFKRVRYQSSGDVITREEWEIGTASSAGGYGSSLGSGGAADLIENVDTFEVSVPGALGDYTTNLPVWVGLKVTLSQDSGGSSAGFRVWSVGRNGLEDTVGGVDDDDIRTWR